MANPIKIEGGERYGRLTLTGKDKYERHGKTNTRVRFVECVCDCGNVVWVRFSNLRFATKSCGCLVSDTSKHNVGYRIKHGMVNSRIYRIYQGLVRRCTYKKHISYKYYGGKGINVKWKNFEDFYKDMGNSYYEHIKEFGEKNTTIDRINRNGDYCKENCKWSTWKEQMHNRDIVDNYGFNYSNLFKGNRKEED